MAKQTYHATIILAAALALTSGCTKQAPPPVDTAMRVERADAFRVYQEKRDAARKLATNSVGNPDKDIYAGIYQAARSYDEVLGVYAALKGYDAMIQPNGNHCGNSFMIVFNRSKIITRK